LDAVSLQDGAGKLRSGKVGELSDDFHGRPPLVCAMGITPQRSAAEVRCGRAAGLLRQLRRRNCHESVTVAHRLERSDLQVLPVARFPAGSSQSTLAVLSTPSVLFTHLTKSVTMPE
jgi:hypothetical protein